jgi:hypothetical protein
MLLCDAEEATFWTVSRSLRERLATMRAQHCAAVLAELLAWGHLRVANRTNGYSRLHNSTVL